MADYTIRFTNPNRATFLIPENRTDGTVSPDVTQLMPNADDANTSLQLLGRRITPYGDYVWQDLVYMLEHFANDVPPVAPIPGQLWFNDSTNELSVFNGTAWELIASGPTSGNLDMGGYRIVNLGDPVDPQDATTKAYTDSTFLPLAGGTVTGTIVTSGASTYVVLPNLPFLPPHAANKQYVDQEIAAATAAIGGAYVPLAGGTMTGSLIVQTGDVEIQSGGLRVLTGTTTLQATNVNGPLTTGVVTINTSLTVDGPTSMSQQLSMFAPIVMTPGNIINMATSAIINVPDPVNDLDAVNKQYVDQAVVAAGAGGAITGGFVDQTTGIITINTGAGPVSLTGAVAPFDHTHTATQVSVSTLAMSGDILSDQAVTDGSTPTINVERAFYAVDSALTTVTSRRRRFVATNPATTVTLPFQYFPGKNMLNCYVNGVRQLLSRRAEAAISVSSLINPIDVMMYVPDTYTFNITVNGVLYSNVTLNVTTPWTYTETVNGLQAALQAAGAPVSVFIDGNEIVLQTNSSGPSSSILLAAPSSGTNWLTYLTDPDEVDATLSVSDTVTQTGNYAEVGAFDAVSTSITLLFTPTASDVLEVECLPYPGTLTHQ